MATAEKTNQLFREQIELVNQLTKSVKSLVTVAGQLNTSSSKQATSQSTLSKKAEELNTAQKKLIATQKERKNVVTQTHKIIAKGTIAEEKNTKKLIKEKVKLAETNRRLREEAKKELGLTKKRTSLFKSFTKSILAAGAAFVSFRAATIVMRKLLTTSLQFSKGMSEVAAITGAVGKDFKALQSNALKLGASTSKTALEVARLQKEFAKLGFSTKDILNATEATIALSIAAGSDLAESAVVAASTVRGFGLSAKETQQVVDVMAKSFSSSALDLNKFKTIMGVAAPIAKAYGKDLQFVTAQSAVLADAGIDASTAGTSLRNIFLELSKRGLTWEEGLEKINNSTNKNSTALDLFGKRGATAALVLAENTGKAGDLEIQLRNSAGAAARMARIMEDNLAGDTKKASSAVEGLFIGLGRRLDPALRKVVQNATKFTRTMSELVTLKPSEELAKEQQELNLLVKSLTNANNTQETRNILLEDLQAGYPDFLGNLNAETATTEELESALKKANIEYDKRIGLLVKEELVKSQQEEIVQLTKDRIDLINQLTIAEEKAQKNRFNEGAGGIYGGALSAEADQINTINNQLDRNAAKQEKLTEELNNQLAILSEITGDTKEVEIISPGKVVEVTEATDGAIDRANKLKEAFAAVDEETLNNVESVRFLVDEAGELKPIEFDIDLDLLDETADEFAPKMIKIAEDSVDAIDKLAKEGNEIFADSAAKRIEKAKEDALELIEVEESIRDHKIEIGTQLFQFFGALQERKIAQLDEETNADIEAVNERYDNQISSAERAGQDTTALEKQKAKEIEAINKKADAEKRKLQRKAAIAEKAQAAFSIILNTAIGVANAASKVLTLPLVPFIATLGAVQLATVLARPIPALAEGTDNWMGGEAKVSDDKSSDPRELFITPDGLIGLTPPKESVMSFPQGTKVFPSYSEETKSFINSGGMSDDLLRQVIIEQQLTRKAMSQKPPQKNTYFTEDAILKIDETNKQKLIHKKLYG